MGRAAHEHEAGYREKRAKGAAKGVQQRVATLEWWSAVGVCVPPLLSCVVSVLCVNGRLRRLLHGASAAWACASIGDGHASQRGFDVHATAWKHGESDTQQMGKREA